MLLPLHIFSVMNAYSMASKSREFLCLIRAMTFAREVLTNRMVVPGPRSRNQDWTLKWADIEVAVSPGQVLLGGIASVLPS